MTLVKFSSEKPVREINFRHKKISMSGRYIYMLQTVLTNADMEAIVSRTKAANKLFSCSAIIMQYDYE